MRLTSSSTDDLVQVRNSGVHGLGVFARHRLAKGTPVGVYEGRRYTAEMLLESQWDSGLTYLFALSDGTTIDGGEGGNATRHLNHACVPNCEAREEFTSDGALVLGIFTVRPVAKDAELFIDYALVIDDSEATSDYPCCCGHDDCRGTMAAAPI